MEIACEISVIFPSIWWYKSVGDTLTAEQRRHCMASVRQKDTKPEILARKALHRMGYRFRLHRRDLPGNPDIVLPKYKSVVFVHGCFWHGHPGCPRAKRPATNKKFWNEKIEKNITRDREAQAALEDLGWRVAVIWSCEVKDGETLESRLANFLTTDG